MSQTFWGIPDLSMLSSAVREWQSSLWPQNDERSTGFLFFRLWLSFFPLLTCTISPICFINKRSLLPSDFGLELVQIIWANLFNETVQLNWFADSFKYSLQNVSRNVMPAFLYISTNICYVFEVFHVACSLAIHLRAPCSRLEQIGADWNLPLKCHSCSPTCKNGTTRRVVPGL